MSRIPTILEAVIRQGHNVWATARSLNMVVLRGPGGPGDWDGLFHLAWRDGPRTGWTMNVWPCATRPGLPYLRDPMSELGTAVIEPGQYPLAYSRGLHHNRPALVQVRPVTVRRDGNKDGVLSPGNTTYTGLFAVNIHDVLSPDQLAGCIGLSTPHLAEVLSIFDTMVPYQGPSVTLTLIT